MFPARPSGRRTRTLIFADLHLEKGSSYARGRQFLPPYDTRGHAAAHGRGGGALQPRRIIALGDSFHDPAAAERLSRGARGRCWRRCAGEFIWIAGNHDPHPPAWLGGTVTEVWRRAGSTFRHEPRMPMPRPAKSPAICILAPRSPNGAAACGGAVLPPMAARMVLPSFGAYTGGLDVGEDAIAGLFGARFHAFMLGEERVYAIPRDRQARAAEQQRRYPAHDQRHDDGGQAIAEGLVMRPIVKPPLQPGLVDEQGRGLGAFDIAAPEQEDLHVILARASRPAGTGTWARNSVSLRNSTPPGVSR